MLLLFSRSVLSNSVTPWAAAHQASLSFTISQSLLKLMSIESVMPSKISSSVVPFSCLQSFPASGSFLMSWLFVSGGQSIGISTSASDHPKNVQGSFPLGLTSQISLQSKGSQESSPTPQFKSINSSVLSILYGPTLTSLHDRKIEHVYNFNKHCQVILKESEFIYAPSISMLCLSSCVVSMCIMKSGYYQFLQYLLV